MKKGVWGGLRATAISTSGWILGPKIMRRGAVQLVAMAGADTLTSSTMSFFFFLDECLEIQRSYSNTIVETKVCSKMSAKDARAETGTLPS